VYVCFPSMVGLSIIHFSVLSFLFFLKVYIWPLFFFCFWECMSLIYKKNEDNLVHTHMGYISLFFSFWMYMTTFFFFFFKNIWVCRVEEKTGKEKTWCDPADPTGWPGKTRSKPGCNPLTFVFFTKMTSFWLKKKLTRLTWWPDQNPEPEPWTGPATKPGLKTMLKTVLLRGQPFHLSIQLYKKFSSHLIFWSTSHINIFTLVWRTWLILFHI